MTREEAEAALNEEEAALLLKAKSCDGSKSVDAESDSILPTDTASLDKTDIASVTSKMSEITMETNTTYKSVAESLPKESSNSRCSIL